MSGRVVRQDRERLFDQPDCTLVSPTLMRDDPEKVQSVGMIRGFLQYLAVKRLCPIPPPGPVVGEGSLKVAEDVGLPPCGRLVVW